MKSPLLFQNQPVVQIADAQNQILVSPDHGARILRWVKAGREVIRWPDNADWSKILKVRGGNPVLFPFIARHFVDGKNELWRDASGTVRPMPQHGFARDAKFTVIGGGPDNGVRMRLTDSDETRKFYPFGFQFDVVVSLLPGSRLEVRFETTNPGGQPIPYYAGHHFYFAIPHQERADWTLHLPCAQWGRQSADGAVIHEVAAAGIIGLADPTAIDRYQIQPTSAQVTLVNHRTKQQLVLDLEQPGSAPWYAVTTWTEAADSDFYCVEPWLGLPNAIHHGEGLRWVAPGTTETASLVIDGSGW
jgi:galactose mutarotase-like enzyme